MADDEAAKKAELNNSLKEYIAEWRKTREAEEEELTKLKEKQAKRKEIRAEQEKKLNAQKKEEEDKLRQEEADRKAKEAEEKKKKLEEAEAERQKMLEAQKAQKADAADKKKSVAGGPGNDARKELSKTKEQLEEEKKIALSIRIKPLALEEMDSDELKSKAEELFKTIIQMETDKYDYEQRKLTQELDLKELKERQKAQLRAKALKKGLDPEALVGKYPPNIRMYSKYERRTDTRSYDDRKKLYEGGWEVVRAEHLESAWKEKYDEWSKRPSKKLPKWFGERPGKKKGAPETPEGEEEAEAAAAEEEDYDEEEEEEEYDEEEE
jgi:troponin T